MQVSVSRHLSEECLWDGGGGEEVRDGGRRGSTTTNSRQIDVIRIIPMEMGRVLV